jgi:hypothetical protein
MPPLKPWLRKTIIVLVLFEVFYLGLINLALSLPVTQTLINQIKPDKFAVSWEKAWSWYPFRVHATGVSANGQSRGQQWQVDAPQASASISLIPLLWKTVSLSGAEATDVVFHMRPRPRADKDHSKIRPYFAPIKNRQLETEPAPEVAKKKGKAWDISVDGMRISTFKPGAAHFHLRMASLILTSIQLLSMEIVKSSGMAISRAHWLLRRLCQKKTRALKLWNFCHWMPISGPRRRAWLS